MKQNGAAEHLYIRDQIFFEQICWVIYLNKFTEQKGYT